MIDFQIGNKFKIVTPVGRGTGYDKLTIHKYEILDIMVDANHSEYDKILCRDIKTNHKEMFVRCDLIPKKFRQIELLDDTLQTIRRHAHEF